MSESLLIRQGTISGFHCSYVIFYRLCHMACYLVNFPIYHPCITIFLTVYSIFYLLHYFSLFKLFISLAVFHQSPFLSVTLFNLLDNVVHSQAEHSISPLPPSSLLLIIVLHCLSTDCNTFFFIFS